MNAVPEVNPYVRSLDERAERDLAMLDRLQPTTATASLPRVENTAVTEVEADADAPDCIEIALQKLDGEPLLAIADEAGGEWPRRARAAALALHGVEEETPSIGVELLRDVEAAFKDRGTSRLASRALLEILTGDDEAPWATWNRGKPLSVRQLAARLAEFEIKPKTTRLPNGDRLKGYVIEDFADAFHRYLSAAGGISSVTPRQPHSSAVCEASATVTHDAASRIAEAPEPAWDKACNGVTDKNGGSEKKEEGGTEREAFDL